MSNKRISKGILSLLMAAGIVATSFVSAPKVEAASLNSYGLATNIKDGNILHCFDWTYQQIIDELPNIASAGFTSVQTSPAQAARTDDGTWYYLYQPSGFYVGNAGLGSEDDLKRLCSEADKYGIKIIVDVVANHLAGDHTYIDDSLKPYEYWHNCYGGIDYNNRYEITHHNIGMPDINSENSYVQQKVQWYISQLKSDGVDGIRWDAAKHISLPSEGCGFWSSVIDKSMFNYGEILDRPVCNNDGYANSLMSEYTDYMSVSDAVYSRSVMQAINSGSVPTGYGFWTLVNGIEDDEVVYFAETHDTYSNNTNEDGWTKYIDQNKVDRAYAIVASKANASALYFSRPYATEKTAIKIGAKGSTSFKNPEIAAVNKLHNQCAGESEYYSTTGNVAVVARQTGATLVLGSGCNQTVTVNNAGSQLQPGTYKDAVSGSTFEVTASSISGYIGLSGIAVLLQEETNPDTPVNPDEPDNPIDEPDVVKLYFSNNYNWNQVYAYTWGGSSEGKAWPGEAMTYVKQNEFNESIYSITVPNDIDGLIFTDGNGNQTIDIKGDFTDGLGYYISGTSSNKYTVGTYSYQ
ncbi:alpha-amylase family glycosyl hydrolase [Pseudobutyrivibrio sp.]|uniref:alpha-amylase family glycosyl hydrolase n=1 Tax=Pseudobutyrivibrio sp. TaxID=2014367 RepID=UPI001B4E1E5B|nr:alpha-amylase family glycosyl hydrolase [Pseudobutyrivibrio sp.]MBP3263432.1 starch-binding protein [Pseudobutyrivibrio sp.]